MTKTKDSTFYSTHSVTLSHTCIYCKRFLYLTKKSIKTGSFRRVDRNLVNWYKKCLAKRFKKINHPSTWLQNLLQSLCGKTLVKHFLTNFTTPAFAQDEERKFISKLYSESQANQQSHQQRVVIWHHRVWQHSDKTTSGFGSGAVREEGPFLGS